MHEVFGVSNEVLPDSYVDRGALDGQIAQQLARPGHLALKGSSKSGKSWLRQQLMPDALVVQCRLDKSVIDVYADVLAQLGVRLEVSTTNTSEFKGKVSAAGELGIKLIAKARVETGLEMAENSTTTSEPAVQDVNNLRFIAELIKASGRALVIEDFHYLNRSQRAAFAFDLKTLWDEGLFVTVVGVWSDNNYLLQLNPDLTARVKETSIVWSNADLAQIFARGGAALNLEFAPALIDRAVADCYGNAGILQRLIVDLLDHRGITESAGGPPLVVDDVSALEHVGMEYAEELNSVYQPFATRVSAGIRTRQNATGIYAHTLAAVLERTDQELIAGLHIDDIFAVASAREPRIQKGNLRTALGRIEGMQVDGEGRGLVLSYADDRVRVVDRQLLLYRKYATVHWPWQELIAEAEREGQDFSGD